MQDISIRPTALKYAIIYAVAMIVHLLITFSFDLIGNTAFSFLSYAISIVAVLLAIMEYKKLNGGFLALKQGVLIGLIVRIVGEILTGIYNFIYFRFINEEGIPRILREVENKMIDQGVPPEAMESAMSWTELTTQPASMFFIGMASALIAGTLFGLIIGAILQKNRFTQK